MKIKLIFHDWIRDGESIYNTEEGVYLSFGDFHSGTTFNGTIELNTEQRAELLNAIQSGAHPVFMVVK